MKIKTHLHLWTWLFLINSCGDNPHKGDLMRSSIPPKTEGNSTANPLALEPGDDSTSLPSEPEGSPSEGGESHVAEQQQQGSSGKSFTMEDLAYLVVSSEEVGKINCDAVLAHGIYNTERNSDVAATLSKSKEYACHLEEKTLADALVEILEGDLGESSESNKSANLAITVIGGGDGSASASLSEAKDMSQSQKRHWAEEKARTFKNSQCQELETHDQKNFAHNILSQKIDQGVIAAWKSCVTKKQKGFFCASSELDGHVSIEMNWQPNAVAQRILPRLKLEWESSKNVESLSELPQYLGAGSRKVAFARMDPEQNAMVVVTGHDGEHQVQFACELNIPTRKEFRVVRDAACGVESYKSLPTPACDAKTYQSRKDKVCGIAKTMTDQGEVCGIEAFRQREDALCGPLHYITERSPACGYEQVISKYDVVLAQESKNMFYKESVVWIRGPGGQPWGTRKDSKRYTDAQLAEEFKQKHLSLLEDREAINRHCRDHYGEHSFAVDGEQRQAIYLIKSSTNKSKRTHIDLVFKLGCQIPIQFGACAHESHGVRQYKTCAHKNFGVIYKSCQHPSFGVEYNSCRHSSFGVEEFQSCRHPNHGVELYRECLVQM